MNHDILITVSLFIVGFLYASVGHGGASGYISVLSIFGVPVTSYKSMILVLNMLVAGVGFTQFYKAGYFKWKLCWPFLITSIPCAYLGSKLSIEQSHYNLLLGIALLVPAIRLIGFGPREKTEMKPVNLPLALIFGVIIGFLSGLLNIGGGIFLSPVLILLGWANAKESAAVSSIFIVLNSFSGLLGGISNFHFPANSSYIWFIAAAAGGFAGAYFGSKQFTFATIRYLLTLVLCIASVKLIFFM